MEKEQLFEKHVKQEDTVKKGQLLISFDLDKMKEKNLNTETAVVVSNSNQYIDILLNGVETVCAQDPIFTCIRSKNSTNLELKEA